MVNAVWRFHYRTSEPNSFIYQVFSSATLIEHTLFCYLESNTLIEQSVLPFMLNNLHKNSQTVIKRCGPCKKRPHEKSCEIKVGGPEVAVMLG